MKYRFLGGLFLLPLLGCTSTLDNQTRQVPTLENRQPELKPIQYLLHDDLAALLSKNIVRVKAQHGSGCPQVDEGFGFVVNHTQNEITIAVPKHIITTEDCAEPPEILVSSCKGGERYTAQLKASSDNYDMAFLSSKRPPSSTYTDAVIARKLNANDTVWLVGFDGTCEHKEIGEYLRSAIKDTFIVSKPALGGSSGGLLFTEWGAIGLVLSQKGRKNYTIGLPFSVIKSELSLHRLKSGDLKESNNTPPVSKVAVRQKYIKVVGDYVFNAQQMNDFFRKQWYTVNNLRYIVPQYNQAFLAFDSEEQLIKPYIAKYWPDQSTQADRVIELCRQTHLQIRELNTDINSVASTNSPTQQLELRLANLQVPLESLRAEYANLKEKLDD